jgi:peroxiredoxin
MKSIIILVIVIAMSLSASGFGADKKFGIEGKPAPKWDIKEWFNLPEGKTTLDLKDFKGKVVYITFFQTMCGGCHQHGLPTLKSTFDTYNDNPDVAFVAIQTAFEQYDKNNMDGAKKTAKEFDLPIPVGHQGQPKKPAPILWTYDAPGTPWTIVIDKKGIVRFNQNYTTPKQAKEKVEELLAETD